MFYTVSFPPKCSSSVSEVLLLAKWIWLRKVCPGGLEVYRGTSEQVPLIVFPL